MAFTTLSTKLIFELECEICSNIATFKVDVKSKSYGWLGDELALNDKVEKIIDDTEKYSEIIPGIGKKCTKCGHIPSFKWNSTAYLNISIFLLIICSILVSILLNRLINLKVWISILIVCIFNGAGFLIFINKIENCDKKRTKIKYKKYRESLIRKGLIISDDTLFQFKEIISKEVIDKFEFVKKILKSCETLSKKEIPVDEAYLNNFINAQFFKKNDIGKFVHMLINKGVIKYEDILSNITEVVDITIREVMKKLERLKGFEYRIEDDFFHAIKQLENGNELYTSYYDIILNSALQKTYPEFIRQEHPYSS